MLVYCLEYLTLHLADSLVEPHWVIEAIPNHWEGRWSSVKSASRDWVPITLGTISLKLNRGQEKRLGPPPERA